MTDFDVFVSDADLCVGKIRDRISRLEGIRNTVKEDPKYAKDISDESFLLLLEMYDCISNIVDALVEMKDKKND
jgi:hypothetical protein